jgi:hypothetical protein
MSTNPPSPPPTQQETGADGFKQTVDNAIQSQIGKIVVTVVVPLLLPLGTSLAYGLQKWFGIKLSGASLATYLGTIAAGIAITAYKWLENRGAWEKSVLEIAHLHDVGANPDGAANGSGDA